MKIKIDLEANIKNIQKGISKAISDAFSNVGVKGSSKGKGGASSGVGEGRTAKKGVRLMGGIFKLLAVIGALLGALQPIVDVIKIAVMLVMWAILKLWKWFSGGGFGALISFIVTKLGEWFTIAVDWLAKLPGKIWELLQIGFNFLIKGILWLTEKTISLLAWLGGWIWDGLRWLGGWLLAGWDLLKEKISEWLSNIMTKIIELKTALIEKLQTLKDKLAEKMERVISKLASMWETLKSIPGRIASSIKGAIGSLNPFKKKDSIDDGIVTKDGKVIKTNPNDTIIATQNPGGTGGGKTFNFYGVTPEAMMNTIRTELMKDTNSSGRF